MTDPTAEPDNPAAYALARHIADHPLGTVQAAFRYLNAGLAIELHEDPDAAAGVTPATDQAALPESARLHDEILTLQAELAKVRDLLRAENQRGNAAIDREEVAETDALEQQQEVRRLGLMVDEYGAGASALTDKLRRVRDLHREVCPVAQGVILPPAAVCGLCEVLDAPAAVLPPPADRAAVLTAVERRFLAFALDCAAEGLSLGVVATDEDRAALEKLRRLAAETAGPCVCGEPSTPGTVHRTDGPCYIVETAGPETQAARCERCSPGPEETEPNYIVDWSEVEYRTAQSGVDTPGCDCGHDGMGPGWHAPGCDWMSISPCDTCGRRGHSFEDCPRAGEPAVPSQPEPGVVAYRNPDRSGVLLCREHGEGWRGLTPVTSEDLPDGGTCTYGDPADPDDVCGVDVLIAPAAVPAVETDEEA